MHPPNGKPEILDLEGFRHVLQLLTQCNLKKIFHTLEQPAARRSPIHSEFEVLAFHEVYEVYQCHKALAA
jgi:hypothetical protein